MYFSHVLDVFLFWGSVSSPVVPDDGVELFLLVPPGELVQPVAEDAHHGGGEDQQGPEHAANDEERPAVREWACRRRRNRHWRWK